MSPDDADRSVESKAARRRRYAAPAALAVLGSMMLLFGALIWLDTSPPGKSVVDKTSTTSVTEPPKPATADTAPAPKVSEVHSVDTTTPGEPTLRSEAVAATLFGLGALLLLCGVFFPRISKITLPGGAGIELIAPETQAKVVEKTVAQAMAVGLALEPKTLAVIYRDSIATLLGAAGAPPPAAMGGYRSRRAGGPPAAPERESGAIISPSDDLIDAVVKAATDRVARGRR